MPTAIQLRRCYTNNKIVVVLVALKLGKTSRVNYINKRNRIKPAKLAKKYPL